MVQQFPSLMFVRRIPYQTVRRRKIRDLALLLVRLTALALIIAAFARPFLWRPPDARLAVPNLVNGFWRQQEDPRFSPVTVLAPEGRTSGRRELR